MRNVCFSCNNIGHILHTLIHFLEFNKVIIDSLFISFPFYFVSVKSTSRDRDKDKQRNYKVSKYYEQ